ncbi:MAG: UDP-N-acetylmuramoyl-L-alanyl-D-glutamate--2,6-diaminopimelate ligase [Chloroflexota bacterium]|jgi:UDP-N-acetylmuramoyl-L-alanyl-D-glutamate--2,6-diaminopimelate ligase|nr:UDP-N-acetylmuramoyl-L-alanyl-D-glutamate--2,6-diaminopimelate ligase [Chloroflexota bacterium]
MAAADLSGLAELLRARGLLRSVDGSVDGVALNGVQFDSRDVSPGDLFVAITGAATDGHLYCAPAVERGAAALIMERPLPDVAVPQLIVTSSRSALALAAAWLHRFPSRELGVIGITGTDGKTTTSYLVRGMLAECGYPAGLLTTIEAVVGGESRGYLGHTTPEAPIIQADLRAMVDAGDAFAVVETTSHGLALERVAEVAYDIAVLTNITHEHLDLHGTYEAYVAAKQSLFSRLAMSEANPDKGYGKHAVINARDAEGASFAAAARDAGANVLTYSVGDDTAADIVGTDVRDLPGSVALSVRTARWQGEVEVHLAGSFNAHNALAAIGVGEALGLDPVAMRRGLSSVRHVTGRMQPVDAGQPFDVYVDFAHTPGALAATIAALAPVAAARGGGVISLFGSPGSRDIAKRPMMGAAAAEHSRVVIVTADDPRNEDPAAIAEEIAAGALAAGKTRGTDLFIEPDRRAAIRRAFEIAQPNDIVLLAGKGHEATIAMKDGPQPWDEPAIAAAILRELGYPRP